MQSYAKLCKISKIMGALELKGALPLYISDIYSYPKIWAADKNVPLDLQGH